MVRSDSLLHTYRDSLHATGTATSVPPACTLAVMIPASIILQWHNYNISHFMIFVKLALWYNENDLRLERI